MTKEEDKKKGNLTVTLPYIEFSQYIKSSIYHHEASIIFLNKISCLLDTAAMEKGIKERERRIESPTDRRMKERRKRCRPKLLTRILIWTFRKLDIF